MAPLTWRNVHAPDFSGVSQSHRLVADLLRNSFSGLQDSIGRFQDSRNQARTTEDIAAALRYQDPAQLRAALASGEISARTLEGLNFLATRPEQLLRDEGLGLENVGLGIQNRRGEQQINHADIRMGMERAKHGELMRQYEEARANQAQTIADRQAILRYGSLDALQAALESGEYVPATIDSLETALSRPQDLANLERTVIDNQGQRLTNEGQSLTNTSRQQEIDIRAKEFADTQQDRANRLAKEEAQRELLPMMYEARSHIVAEDPARQELGYRMIEKNLDRLKEAGWNITNIRDRMNDLRDDALSGFEYGNRARNQSDELAARSLVDEALSRYATPEQGIQYVINSDASREAKQSAIASLQQAAENGLYNRMTPIERELMSLGVSPQSATGSTIPAETRQPSVDESETASRALTEAARSAPEPQGTVRPDPEIQGSLWDQATITPRSGSAPPTVSVPEIMPSRVVSPAELGITMRQEAQVDDAFNPDEALARELVERPNRNVSSMAEMARILTGEGGSLEGESYQAILQALNDTASMAEGISPDIAGIIVERSAKSQDLGNFWGDPGDTFGKPTEGRRATRIDPERIRENIRKLMKRNENGNFEVRTEVLSNAQRSQEASIQTSKLINLDQRLDNYIRQLQEAIVTGQDTVENRQALERALEMKAQVGARMFELHSNSLYRPGFVSGRTGLGQ